MSIKLLLLLIPSFLLGQVQSIDLGSSTQDQFCTGGFAYTILTPGATGDLTLRFGVYQCRIPTPPGLYDVKLILRETGTVTSPGQRLFSVSVNGQPVFLNFDLFADSGLNPLQRTFETLSNGFIVVDVSYSLRSGVLSRIEWKPKAQPPAAFPTQVSEIIPIPESTPLEQELLSFVLTKTPVSGSQLISILQSSRLGNGKVVARTVDQTKPKEVEFLLPFYRPFAGDVIQVLYWTLE